MGRGDLARVVECAVIKLPFSSSPVKNLNFFTGEVEKGSWKRWAGATWHG